MKTLCALLFFALLILGCATAGKPVPPQPRLVDAELRVRYFQAKDDLDVVAARFQSVIREMNADCGSGWTISLSGQNQQPTCMPPAPAKKP